MLHAQRILAIPSKRHEKRPVEFLTEQESAALIAAPGPDTWIGRRDRALLLLAVQTGLRNSEITTLERKDIPTGTGAHVRCLGKGRKQRCTPLRQEVAAVPQQWLSRQPGAEDDPLFPGSRAAACLPARPGCPARMSLIGGQAGDPAHAAPRRRHGLAPLWCRPQRHRALTGP
jgi:integrase